MTEKTRQKFFVESPKVFSGNYVCKPAEQVLPESDTDKIKELFKNTFGTPRIEIVSAPGEKSESRVLRVGVVLSGGQAPGGHNVIIGMFDQLKTLNPASTLFGFRDGPIGIMKGRYMELTKEFLDKFRNTGGFHMIGSGRDKIKTAQQFADSAKNCAALDLDGLVVIGGDDSNTNAALLGEYFSRSKVAAKCKVLGAPKTIDGDLKLHPYIPVSFGFDTCTKIFSELIGNIALDALSTQKYYHFIRLMGRSASHITLECALQTHPNVTLIGEEVQAKNQSLQQVAQYIAGVVQERSAMGKDFGVVLVPEGIIEFIPEIGTLISEINDVLASGVKAEDVADKLTKDNRALLLYLPKNIRRQVLLDRDAHGNVKVSQIETEKLISALVAMELEKMRSNNVYKGTFRPQCHFYGYEGRCGLPSNFDSRYCHAIGRTVITLCDAGYTGLIASIGNILAPVSEWTVSGTPISGLLNIERRHGHSTPVIKKALTELDGAPFAALSKNRAKWALQDCYRSPGPVQYTGPGADDVTQTLRLEVEARVAASKQT